MIPLDKEILGLVATGILLVSYIPYYRGIFKGEVKPHAFSWGIWTLTMGIAATAQFSEQGGAGAWPTVMDALICFFVFVMALFRGVKRITLSDCIFLALALAAIPLWMLSHNPLYSVLLVSLIDVLGFYPTFRKSWHKPFEETVITYICIGTTFAISLFALEQWTMTTWFYPAMLLTVNIALVAWLYWRRSATKISGL